MNQSAVESIRVLHVDDDEAFTDLTAVFLEREEDRIVHEAVSCVSDGLERLAEGGIDCVVSDFDMPGRDGIEFLDAAREDHPAVPFILFTGKGSEEVASEAISAGVSDYLQKQYGTEHFELLANQITNHVERTRTQRALEARESHLRQAQAVANLGSWQLDLTTDQLYWSEEVYTLFELPVEESLTYEEFLEFVHPDDRAYVDEEWSNALDGDEYSIEHRIVTRTGETRWVRERAEIHVDGEGTPTTALGVVQDISDRKTDEG